jgi:hypothetical protein
MQTNTNQILSRDVLKAANISPDTLLATDFLNLYNEVAMLVDFLPGDEEIITEILEWQPEGYVDHFTHSGFRDKNLAIEAYSQADPDLISEFEAACKILDDKIIAIQQLVIASRFEEAILIGKGLFDDIGTINGLIVGGASGDNVSEDTDSGISQSDIDSLFD